jgi:hypothetical protein
VGKVDKGLLRVALETLVSDGLIGAWAPRPLGMYAILLRTGDELRLDAKEAALWVEGARYTQAVTAVDASFQAASPPAGPAPSSSAADQQALATAEARVRELEQQLVTVANHAARVRADHDQLSDAVVALSGERERLAARVYAQGHIASLDEAGVPENWDALLAEPPAPLPPAVQELAETLLERAVELNGLVGWERDDNDDYTVVMFDGATQFLYARDALHVALGILRADEARDLEYWLPDDPDWEDHLDDEADEDGDAHTGDGVTFTLGDFDDEDDAEPDMTGEGVEGSPR